MKTSLPWILTAATTLLLLFPLLARASVDVPAVAERVKQGTAILVDVREPAEWAEGVVEGAQLLALSDLQGDRQQWKAFLAANNGKEIALYCRSGRRSGVAAKILSSEGFKSTNAGGYADWVKAGQKTTKP